MDYFNARLDGNLPILLEFMICIVRAKIQNASKKAAKIKTLDKQHVRTTPKVKGYCHKTLVVSAKQSRQPMHWN
jgi:hypothetical protein